MNEDRYPKEVLGEDEDNGTMPESVELLAEHIVGHRIVSVEKGVKDFDAWGYPATASRITLDNGKSVFLANTDDCCAFTELEEVIMHLDKIDHVITGIGTTDGYETWHIYADLGDVVELKVGWSSGNPFYYGYGFSITVR